MLGRLQSGGEVQALAAVDVGFQDPESGCFLAALQPLGIRD